VGGSEWAGIDESGRLARSHTPPTPLSCECNLDGDADRPRERRDWPGHDHPMHPVARLAQGEGSRWPSWPNLRVNPATLINLANGTDRLINVACHLPSLSLLYTNSNRYRPRTEGGYAGGGGKRGGIHGGGIHGGFDLTHDTDSLTNPRRVPQLHKVIY